jgi:hypothetical protein
VSDIQKYWARKIPEEVARRAQVIFATDHEGLILEKNARIKELEALVKHPTMLGLAKRVSELESLVREARDLMREALDDVCGEISHEAEDWIIKSMDLCTTASDAGVKNG